ncbi:MAG: hypothetical protein AB9842_01075 [Bacteroidales bacterium]
MSGPSPSLRVKVEGSKGGGKRSVSRQSSVLPGHAERSRSMSGPSPSLRIKVEA